MNPFSLSSLQMGHLADLFMWRSQAFPIAPWRPWSSEPALGFRLLGGAFSPLTLAVGVMRSLTHRTRRYVPTDADRGLSSARSTLCFSLLRPTAPHPLWLCLWDQRRPGQHNRASWGPPPHSARCPWCPGKASGFQGEISCFVFSANVSGFFIP